MIDCEREVTEISIDIYQITKALHQNEWVSSRLSYRIMIDSATQSWDVYRLTARFIRASAFREYI